ncbi:D-erythrulose reductase [Orchesella cincta]|uniref:D-erythrulose reductase n=1 Tax=Orchesella cincta TaxID=48709 RepID=A0A1D2MX43_ORCCI|nr:D-erythrulose reductase [Orchesella cincta]
MSGQESLKYSFSGRKVLITGGGRGIGRALLERLYNDGALIFTLEKEADFVDQLRKEFPNVKAEVADITEWNKTQQIIESFGPVDHLINNAGTFVSEALVDVTESSVDTQIDLNLKSLFCVTQAVARGMIAQGTGGTVVNIASLAGVIGTPLASVYSVSKAGVIMFSNTLAAELGKHNIRVNSFSPTAVDTPMFRQAEHTWPKDFYIHRQPLQGKNVLELDEAVNSILFLLSPLSSMTNGHNLIVDGGIAIS